MSQTSLPDRYFTKHLFRSGLRCPTRLFYKAHDYPESIEALPFIEHIHYNKSRLKTLARCFYPEGVAITANAAEPRHAETVRQLENKQVVIFDAVLIWEQIKVRFPLIEKKGEEVRVFQFQTRAFDPDRHKLISFKGRILAKWEDYLLDFAFQVFVMKQIYPDWSIRPYLVLPNKVARSKLDRMHELLKAVRQGKKEPQSILLSDEDLLVKIDVAELIQKVWKGDLFDESYDGLSFMEIVRALKEQFFNAGKYPVSLGDKCKNCEFRIEQTRVCSGEKSGFLECWSEKTGRSPGSGNLVFDLIGPGTRDWIEKQIFFTDEIPSGDVPSVNELKNATGSITERQRQALQILKAKGLKVPQEIIRPQLFEELRVWEYPIHFLDFEAGNYTIPIRKNRTPYHLVAFQYSCHTLYEDGSWSHNEWIHDGNEGYPNYEFLRQLSNVPDIEKGTIVQYSNFERHTLKTIRKELLAEGEGAADGDALIKWTERIIHRYDSNRRRPPYLADLSRMVRNYYYNNRMGNSLSIKDVLQSIMTISEELKQRYRKPYSSSNFDSIIWWQQSPGDLVKSPYTVMHEQQKTEIRRGTEAMVVYGKLLFGEDEGNDLKRNERLNSLLKYCELDTLAMLMIFQHWQSLCEVK